MKLTTGAVDLEGREMVGKAFVRKYPANLGGTGREITMVIMLVDGDITSLSNEAMHLLKVEEKAADLEMSVSLKIMGVAPTDRFKGYSADQIATEM